MTSHQEKLELLARQSRALASVAKSRERADALEELARLYERQAKELLVLEHA